MISPRAQTAAVLLSLACLGDTALSQGQPLEVSFSPAAVRPGDVVRVEIANAARGETISATFPGQDDIAFDLDERAGTWRALLGIDLETEPGDYELTIHGHGAANAIHTVHITPRQFRVRRLKVAPKFVEPPPETVERILRESKLLTELYARASPRQWAGAFVLPIERKPNSNFGSRSYYNGQPRSPHSGVDFAATTGTPIRAANHGTVALAAPLYFTGNTVVIDHGQRLYSIFAHLSAFRVDAGDTVEPDTIVGLVGKTGRVTGPHLHWSVRLNSARVDPLSLVAVTAQ
jgi:murein DD-endopeptidase MepM/ murein hydrolase activator NlpD